MELTNSFVVNLPVERTWEVLTDLGRAAPCLPGAELLGVEGAEHRGAVTIKVGPVTARYEGVARFVERDDGSHHAVLRAEGRDARGQGSAAATIDLTLRGHGAGTEVRIDTDLVLTGRVARFGPGVLADVSGKLVGRFAQCLEAEMTGPGTAAPTTPTTPTTQTTADAPPVAAPDEIEPTGPGSAGRDALRTQALPVGTALVGLLVGWLLGRRGRAGATRARRS